MEAEGWSLEVEQADIMTDFWALNDPVWGDVFKLDGTMTEASWCAWFMIRAARGIFTTSWTETFHPEATVFQVKRKIMIHLKLKQLGDSTLGLT